MNLLMVGAVFLLGLAVVGAAGVFAYGAYLTGVKETKTAKLKDAKANVDAGVVEEFIRMRDRFIEGKSLLDSHVATSGFFDLLEDITLENVRYGSLSLTRLANGSAEFSLEGTARSFNALAAQSAAFSKELRFKRAIFSDIQLDQGGTVSFTLTAEAEPELFGFTLPTSPTRASGAAPATPTAPAPTTPATPAPAPVSTGVATTTP